MPVERTRGSRRAAGDGTELVWTVPATTERGISFATAMTPSTFADESPKTSFFILDPSTALTEPPTPSGKRSHRKRVVSAPGSPPESAVTAPRVARPPNAFILFRSSFVKAQTIPSTLEPSHAALSAIAGHTWTSLPKDQKDVWFSKAREAAEKHARDFPDYTFQPQRVKKDVRATGGRRKRKKDDTPRPRDLSPAERLRSQYIATLLHRGYTKPQLKEALREYDAQRAGQIDVRFSTVETPEARRGGVKSVGSPKKRKTAASTRKSSSPSPFELTLDFDLSACSSPIDSPTAYDWPSPASELDFFGAFDSAPSTAPASPALSFASSTDCSSLPSPTSSYEDLSSFFPSHTLSALDLSLGGLPMDETLGLDLALCGSSLDYEQLAMSLAMGDDYSSGCIAPSQTVHVGHGLEFGQW